MSDMVPLYGFGDGGLPKSKIVNHFTTTEEGFIADARALKTLNDRKSEMELLWQNASPTSEFGAQTLSFDLSEYKFVFMVCFSSIDGGGTIKKIYIAANGEKNVLHAQDCVFYERSATVNNSGITFTNAIRYPTYTGWTTTTANKNIVPYKIYGIKGISA